MARSTFETLPDEARLWLLVLDRPLDATEAARFEAGMEDVLGGWRHKGVAYQGTWSLRDAQLLLVAEPTMAEQPSGCAITGLMTRLARLAAEVGRTFIPDGPLVVCDCGGFRPIAREDIQGALSRGELHGRTRVLDRGLFNLGDMRRGGLTQALAHTWVARRHDLGAEVLQT